MSFGPAMSATISVCSSGCDYTTVAAAVAAAGSTDVIEYRDNITESLSLNKKIAGIQGDSPTARRVWTSSSGGLFVINSGLNQAFFVKNLELVQTANNSVIWEQTSGASTKMSLENLKFTYTVHQPRVAYYNSNGNAVGMMDIYRCEFVGNTTLAGGAEWANATFAGAVTVRSSIFRGFTATGGFGLRMAQASSNAAVYDLNNTFYGNSIGVSLNARGVHTNNVFGGNTDDIAGLSTPVTVNDFSYCAFAEQTNTGGTFGAGCIFGITVANEFVNTSTPDLHVKNVSSQIYNSGTSLAGVPLDFDGLSRPQGTNYEIGAYEFLAIGGAAKYGRQRRGH
jgi:hypothetical protein